MFLAVFFIVLGVLFLIFLKWEYSDFVKKIDRLPGPKKLPLVGNALLIPPDAHGKNVFVVTM